MSTLPEEQAKTYMVKLLTAMCRAGGSDLFISADFPPTMKTHGKMQPMAPQKLTSTVARQLALSLMNERQRDEFAKELECNFAMAIPEVARFRINVFVQQQHTGMVIRTFPAEIPSFETLALRWEAVTPWEAATRNLPGRRPSPDRQTGCRPARWRGPS